MSEDYKAATGSHVGGIGPVVNRASHEGTTRGQINKKIDFSDFRFGPRDPFKTLPSLSAYQEQFFLARIVNFLAVSCNFQKILDLGFLDSAESGQSAQGGQAGECGQCEQGEQGEQGGQGGQEGGRRASLPACPACQPAKPASLPVCQPATLPRSQSSKGAAAFGGRPL